MTYLDERLRNWGRAVRVRPIVQHCFSAEWRYVLNRERLALCEEQDRRTARWPVDYQDAWTVEVASRRLPLRDHRLLALVYVHRRPPWIICATLSIPSGRRFRTLWAQVGLAADCLEQLLEVQADVLQYGENGNTMRAISLRHQFRPPPAHAPHGACSIGKTDPRQSRYTALQAA